MLLVVRIKLNPCRRPAGVIGKVVDEVAEIEVEVADVNCNDSVFLKVLFVELKRFNRKQVNRNRVSTERVDDEGIKLL